MKTNTNTNTNTKTIIDVDALVGEISNLISLPEVYLKIRGLMDDPNSGLDDFAVVVNADPGLVAVVLKIVNSSFFGFSGQIDNLHRALNLIGIGQLHDLVLSLSAVDSLDLPNDIETLQVFWQRSIYCGVFSKILAEKLHLKNSDSLFIVGLLHEIGHLVLFLKYPAESRMVVDQAQAENKPLIEVEKSLFDTNYGKIGRLLMAEWNLPEKFQTITEFHIEPNCATEYSVESTLVGISHQTAVNKFPGADSFQYLLTEDSLATLKMTEEEVSALYADADLISSEMEKMILG